MIADNVAKVIDRIRRAAQRSARGPGEIKLVCVAKGRGLDEIKEVIRCGVADIGENRVREAKEKESVLKDARTKWHLVGHLQTNKVKDAVGMFNLIQSVDSVRLAEAINKEAAKIAKIQDILIEVNTSGEATKFGIRPEDLLDLVKEVIALKNIKLSGLMTIAPVVDDKEEARPYFKKLRQLQDEVNDFLLTTHNPQLTTLSMGMSQDYEVAVEEGATMVRIGTAIFGNADGHRRRCEEAEGRVRSEA